MGQWPNPELRAKIQRQVVALAQAILDGQEPLVPNAQRMTKLLYWLGLEPSTDEDITDFRLIVSETDALPLGSERQYWEPAALAEKDREIVQAEAWARKFGLDTCRRLVQRFGVIAND